MEIPEYAKKVFGFFDSIKRNTSGKMVAVYYDQFDSWEDLNFIIAYNQEADETFVLTKIDEALISPYRWTSMNFRTETDSIRFHNTRTAVEFALQEKGYKVFVGPELQPLLTQLFLNRQSNKTEWTKVTIESDDIPDDSFQEKEDPV